MKLYNSKEMPQRTTTWFNARCGRICSSEVGAAIAADGTLRKARSGGGYADSVWSYVAKVVSERISGYVVLSDYASQDMRYGSEHEEAARDMLGLMTGRRFESIGGCLSDDGSIWASSDGVERGPNGTIHAVAEIKIPSMKRQVAYLMDGGECDFRDEYQAQVATEIVATGAEVGFLFAYGTGLRIERSNVLIEVCETDGYVANVRESLAELERLIGNAIVFLGSDRVRPLPAPLTAAEQAAVDRAWMDSVAS